jgi:hypothetical protein
VTSFADRSAQPCDSSVELIGDGGGGGAGRALLESPTPTLKSTSADAMSRNASRVVGTGRSVAAAPAHMVAPLSRTLVRNLNENLRTNLTDSGRTSKRSPEPA